MEGIITSLILVSSILMDLAFGEPKGKLLKLHPVIFCTSISKFIVKPYSNRIHGLATLLLPVSLTVAFYLSIQYLALKLGLLVYLLVSTVILKTTFSINLLHSIVEKAYDSMVKKDWCTARSIVQQIVRRNVYELDEEHVVSATIESLFESLVDGYTSPLFYYSFLGVKGALLQRAVNTMDSLVGYKEPKYRDEGYITAKADTILNYIPARLTATLIVLSTAILRYNWKGSLRVLLRDHSKTESLNAGWPMSAIAGALNVKLEKTGFYSLGEPIEKLNPLKVKEALKIYKLTVILSMLSYLILITLCNFATTFP